MLPSRRAWLVWSAPVIFYFVAYFVRVSPAVMTQELMRAFSVGAAGLGTLSATYFYAYVAMQIPIGILVDSWGARKLLLVGTLSTACGSFLFGGTGHFGVACIARAIIGGATAVAWISTLKLITHWFPARRFALLTGLSLMIGNVGALVAQTPLRLLVQRFGWRPIIVASGVIVLIIAGLVAWWVRNDPGEIGRASYAPESLRTSRSSSLGEQIRGVGQLFRYRNTWLIFFAQGGLLGPVLTFAGLWGPPYLEARYHMTPTGAADVDMAMLLAFAVASPLMGHCSDLIGGRKPLYVGSAVVAVLTWAMMVLVPGISAGVFVALAAIAGFVGSCCILGFAFGKESVPEKHLGTITGVMNMGNIIGPMILQPGIGLLLDRRWTGAVVHGARVYSATAYRDAFAVMLIWSLASVVLLALTRESHCRQLV
ncbi:MAG: MFS transporter [Terriglobales bacterium]